MGVLQVGWVEVGVLGCGAVTAVWMWRKRRVEVGVSGGGADTAVWMWRKRRVEVGVLADGRLRRFGCGVNAGLKLAF